MTLCDDVTALKCRLYPKPDWQVPEFMWEYLFFTQLEWLKRFAPENPQPDGPKYNKTKNAFANHNSRKPEVRAMLPRGFSQAVLDAVEES
jgi:hypothetical protein